MHIYSGGVALMYHNGINQLWCMLVTGVSLWLINHPAV